MRENANAKAAFQRQTRAATMATERGVENESKFTESLQVRDMAAAHAVTVALAAEPRKNKHLAPARPPRLAFLPPRLTRLA